MFNIRGCCSVCSDMKILFAAFLFLLCGGWSFLFVYNEVIICSCVVVVVIVDMVAMFHIILLWYYPYIIIYIIHIWYSP